jgi:heme A synthase
MNSPGNNFWSRRRWLARLSFSFLILAVFLGYTAYRGAQNHDLSHGRIALHLVAAALAFSLFLMGTREKHRPRDNDADE